MFVVPFLGVELIPQLSQGEFKVEMRLPPGTPLEYTDKTIAGIQFSSRAIDKVKLIFAVAGSGNRFDANPEQGGENWGELNVSMATGSRKIQEEAAMDSIRKALEGIPGLQYKFDRPTYFSFKTPIEVEVAGYDLDVLKKISGDIVRRMRGIDRLTDIKSSMELGHPEIQIYFDRKRAAALGLNVYEVADIVTGTGPSEIRRIDQERVALISANMAYGDLGTAANVITGIINQVEIPADITVNVSGQNEEMNISFRSLKFALLLAIFLVYLVMAAEFESFLHLFVVMFTIPLAFIGGILALWLTGSQISVLVFLGGIILVGIVVNNAIVLIDFVNKNRARGMNKRTALIEAGRSRLRPILMTTLTTVLGLIPLALGIGEGAEAQMLFECN